MQRKDAKNKPEETSLYLRILAGPVKTLAVCASLYGVLCYFYACWAKARRKNTTPPVMLAELYQLGWLLLLTILVFTAPHSGVPRWFALVFVGYRIFDLSIYALYLVLFGKEIASSERSLLLLIGNLVEVVLGSAVFLLNVGCVSDVGLALYSGLRTLATIGPASVVSEEGVCRLVLASQIGIDYFLALVTLALVLSSLTVKLKRRK